ncbi:MAG: alginate lyase family protein [Spirosomataceae bacterium]
MKAFVTALFLILSTPIMYGQKSVHPGGMHTREQIKATQKMIKKKDPTYLAAYQQLLVLADSAFKHPDHALENYSVPGFYVDANGHRTNSRALQSDAFDAYACALAYQLSGNKKYAQEAIRFLNAWAHKNTQYSDADGSLVMSYSGTAMVIAADLVRNSKVWQANDIAAFDQWVANVYKKACDEIRNRKNNWADWGRLGSILAAHYLGDKGEIQENIRLIKSDLSDKIAEDASMPHETRRGANGIWYTYFSLAPITAACWVAYNTTGENLFEYTQDGRNLKMALDYLLKYAIKPEAWPWFEKPNKGAPNRWPGNLFEAMAGIYNDSAYSNYSRPAQPIVYSTHHFAWSFPTLMRPTLKK